MLYRKLTNQQGEVTGYATVYDYDAKNSTRSIKVRQPTQTHN